MQSKTKLSPRDVREKLMREHTTWAIPERRVAKYVKKQTRSSSPGFFGKIISGNKQTSSTPSTISVQKGDDSTATPETHPGSSPPRSIRQAGSNLIKAFSTKKKENVTLKGSGENMFRKSKLDSGKEKTMIPYQNAELERKESFDAMGEAAAQNESKVPAVIQEENPDDDSLMKQFGETPKEMPDAPTDVYADDNDGKTNRCACGECIIL